MDNYGRQCPGCKARQEDFRTYSSNEIQCLCKPRHGDFKLSPISLYPSREKPLRKPGNGLKIDCHCKPLEWRRKARKRMAIVGRASQEYNRKAPTDTAGADLLELHSTEPGTKRALSTSQTIYQKQAEQPEKSNGKKCHIYTSSIFSHPGMCAANTLSRSRK